MDLFEDTSFSLSLMSIRKKIIALYEQMLEKMYKAENPDASPEEIAEFIAENSLEFSAIEEDEGLDEEISELEEAIEAALQTEDLDPVSEKTYSKPEVESGKELKSKSNEKTTAPITVAPEDPKGMFSVPKDTQVKTKTTKVPDPTGTIKKRKKVKVDTSYAPVFKQIQDQLANLKQRQNIGRKELGDRL